jgi:hypothetical protein
MKRIYALVIIAMLLTACGVKITPTISDAEMATKVAQILTSMPTATGGVPKGLTPAAPTGQVPSVAATKSLPTIAPTQAQPTAAPTTAATLPPVATATVPAPTATKVPPTATLAVTKAPTATPVPGDPRTTLGQPTWSDTMGTSDNWPTGADAAGFTQIDFQNGAMLLTALKPSDGWRMSTADALTDFYIELTVNSASCTGKDRYGVIFRVPAVSNPDQGYLVDFTCDGKYGLRKWDGPDNTMEALTLWKTNAAIKAGPNQTNRLGVMVVGSKITIYANGVKLTEVTDTGYKSGFFGVSAAAIDSSKYTVNIDRVDYWIQ